MNIKDYGYKQNIEKQDNKVVARIITTYKDRYEIVSNNGLGFAKIKRGCFYDNPNSIYPTTGDFVLIEWNDSGDSMIFSNCTHTNEPGCKILEAIENGELSRERFDSYIKLQNESRYNSDSETYLKEKKEKFKNIAKINKSGNRKHN